MALARKILGQQKPAATTNADICAPAGGAKQTIATVCVCNTGAATTFRLFARKAGAAAGVGTAINYDTPIQANTTEYITVGLTLDGTLGDILTGYDAGGTVTFTAWGSEET